MTLLVLSQLSALAQTAGKDVAISEHVRSYVDAYTNLQFDKLAGYYTDTSVFQDPTLALIADNAAKPVIGPKAILEKLSRNFYGVTQQSYQLTDAYAVGDYAILSGVYDYVQNATSFGGPDVDIHFSLRSTTVLKSDQGKIIEHVDYMDYTSWFEQFEAQKNQKN